MAMITWNRRTQNSNTCYNCAIFPIRATRGRWFPARLPTTMNNPFPFTKLPPEIRNEIYRLVSSSEEVWFYTGLNHRGRGHGVEDLCYKSFINLTINSTLFRTLRQTRAEGLVLFYQHHHFLLSVEKSGCVPSPFFCGFTTSDISVAQISVVYASCSECNAACRIQSSCHHATTAD